MKQFNPTYRVTVFSDEDTVIVEYPITCKFNVTRATFSDSNKCTIQLYNLAPATRNKIFQDQYQPLIDKKFKYVHLEAGWGSKDSMSLIFRGRILQAYSHKSGGATDIITEIQAVALDIFDCQSSHTFAAGTDVRDAFKVIAADLPNVSIENIGNLQGTFKTPTTFEGSTMEQLNKLTGGNCFVDNASLSCLMSNEVIDVPVPVISKDTTLLDTPMRRDANLEVKTLFLPNLQVGQLVEVDSGVSPNFNGQFKLVGFTHDCLISPTQAGQRITTMTLWYLPLLPGANIALTGANSDGTVTGGAAPMKVKGEDISPVNNTNPNTNWIMPLEKAYPISSPYGWRYLGGVKEWHPGIDFDVPLGTPIRAIADGKVVAVGPANGYGYSVALDHGIINGKRVTSEYGHITPNSWTVRYGQYVKQGNIIAKTGNTGRTTGPHLHITLREGPFQGKNVNPYKYINRNRY